MVALNTNVLVRLLHDDGSSHVATGRARIGLRETLSFDRSMAALPGVDVLE